MELWKNGVKINSEKILKEEANVGKSEREKGKEMYSDKNLLSFYSGIPKNKIQRVKPAGSFNLASRESINFKEV